MKVTIVEYDEAWAQLFAAEKAMLQQVVGDPAVEIEHMGSTSVAGLAAKPVIDILIGLGDFSMADSLVPKIAATGYEYIKEFEVEMPYRRYFTKPHRGADTHHIHMVAMGSEFWTKMLLFRDYLRVNSHARVAYANLKKDLAKLEWKDVDEYATAKTAFIRQTEKAAEEFFAKPDLHQ